MSCALALDVGGFPYPHRVRAHLIHWDTIEKNIVLWSDHHRLRYDVFVERCRWDVPHHQGWEFDQYDNPDAIYILIERDQRCVGCVRLMPTTCPYMIEEVFSDLLPGPPPKDPAIWELTRLGISRGLDPDVHRLVFLHLWHSVINFGLEAGINSFLGVVPISVVKRSYLPNGIPVRAYEGQARKIDNLRTAVGETAVNQSILHDLEVRIQALTDRPRSSCSELPNLIR